MSIDRIEEVVYGVADLDQATRFYTDAGLEVLQAEGPLRELRTMENQRVKLRLIDDPALPPAWEEGPTIRQLVWGVSDLAELDRLCAALGDRATRAGDVVHVVDPNGLALAFRVKDYVPAEEVLRPHNQNAHHERVNGRLDAYGKVNVMRIVHCALNSTKAGNAADLAFYTGPLNFKAVDKVLDTGTFLQTDGDIEHHNFFLCFRPDKKGINHIAMEVYDFDAVIEAGNQMIKAGWKESRRLGRHTLGSNVFRFIQSPCGGRIEFVSDMDRMDKTWETRVWEKNPGHHIWILKSSGGELEEAKG